MRFQHLFICVSLILFVLIAGFANAEILYNGDFEFGLSGWSTWGSGSGSGPSGSIWKPFYGTIADSGGSDGGKYLELETPMAGYYEDWGWAWCDAWQSFPTHGDNRLLDGDFFSVNAFVKNIWGTETLIDGAEISFEWLDETGGIISRDSGFFDVTGDWSSVTHTAFAPEGAVGFNLVISNPLPEQGIGFDMIGHLIPEPISLILFALGGLMLRIKRGK